MNHFMPLGVKQSFTIAITLGLLGLPIATASAQTAAALQEGDRVLINGKPFAGAWARWTNPKSGQLELGISDSFWVRALGGSLLESPNSTQQPVQWASNPPRTLFTQFNPRKTVRYLGIAEAARQWGWQMQSQGNTLAIQTGAAAIETMKLGQQPWGRRLVMVLDRVAPWRMAALSNSRTGRTDRKFTLEVDAAPLADALKTVSVSGGAGLRSLKVTPQQNQTLIEGVIEGGFQPQISTLDNPPRLVLDIRQPLASTRRIVWSPGLEWREAVVNLGQAQFPVTWLAVNPRQPGLRILPFWSGTTGVVGIEGLAKMSQRNQAAGAINAGYFGRDRQTPLGAIRRDGTWISSPILNRGAIAWDPQGRFKVGRLMLKEQMVSSNGAALPITSSNSGYPQKGIARYTSLWGSTYTPLLDKEQIITLINNQVQSVQPAIGGQSFPIPPNGALLAARAVVVGPELAPGTSLQYQMQPSLPEFAAFPNIVGAGPLLLVDGRVVVDAIAEQFSPPFAIQEADRSGIGQTADGTVLLAVTHNRIGGAGPTLGEWAQIMQQLGAVNALNLDGGSSTALYLGGQLLDRHPTTAARVQNGIGIFFQSLIPSSVGSGNIKQKSLK
jgi:Phosphodiester glycosidase